MWLYLCPRPRPRPRLQRCCERRRLQRGTRHLGNANLFRYSELVTLAEFVPSPASHLREATHVPPVPLSALVSVRFVPYHLYLFLTHAIPPPPTSHLRQTSFVLRDGRRGFHSRGKSGYKETQGRPPLLLGPTLPSPQLLYTMAFNSLCVRASGDSNHHSVLAPLGVWEEGHREVEET